MIENYLTDYKVFSKEMYPLSTLDLSESISEDILVTLFRTTEIINTYINSTTTIDSWIIQKLNEIKNQLLISLYYLPHYTSYVFNTFKRSISELTLKIILYSASTLPKETEYQEKINNILFRFLKQSIKELSIYTDNTKILIDTFFSFYGESSNNIHLKDSTSIIEYIESYKFISIDQIKNFKTFIIKLEDFLLDIFPKLCNINDLSLSLSAKIQLKEVISESRYFKHFGI